MLVTQLFFPAGFEQIPVNINWWTITSKQIVFVLKELSVI